MSTNTFVEAYIDRLLEQRQRTSSNERNSTASTTSNDSDVIDDDGDNHHQRGVAGRHGNHGLDVGLTFETFVHTFWVFSASASRVEKEEGSVGVACVYAYVHASNTLVNFFHVLPGVLPHVVAKYVATAGCLATLLSTCSLYHICSSTLMISLSPRAK